MAIYNEILVGRFARGLQKLFGIKGEVPTKQLSGEIISVHPLLNGVENRYLEGWNRFGARVSSVAVAAVVSFSRLRNPAGSNVIAVLEKISFVSGSAADQPFFSIESLNTDLTSAVAYTTQQLDNRGQKNPTLIASVQQTSASPYSGTIFEQVSLNAISTPSYVNVINDVNQELTLLPGMTITFSSNNVNQQLTPHVWWRERNLEESELK